ncbi:unnamed protein product [Vitrella brassicaformis CCMP3155]|uniref:Uncharacterized protein n=1 Tax=Vitrella brassicaformis (strain CCMP3155) TaxID=1169540 RepID=A0A0G4EXS6_VITBC|nr:unnamed protein product [Vitrella brassicaformis CCMP3155]|eukprot:CEM03521.1 unnamed protein product [Vitrella brassicaformis CCMP3155]
MFWSVLYGVLSSQHEASAATGPDRPHLQSSIPAWPHLVRHRLKKRPWRGRGAVTRSNAGSGSCNSTVSAFAFPPALRQLRVLELKCCRITNTGALLQLLPPLPVSRLHAAPTGLDVGVGVDGGVGGEGGEIGMMDDIEDLGLFEGDDVADDDRREKPKQPPRRREISRDSEGVPDSRLVASRQVRGDMKTRYKLLKMPPPLKESGGSPRRTQGRVQAGTNNPSMLRVGGGVMKGRKLTSPPVYLRPMMAKVREAVFNMLTQFGVFDQEEPITFLDLYSGTGAVGIEALSRGAASGTFVDLSKECCQSVVHNLRQCNFQPQGRVIRADVEETLRYPGRFALRDAVDLVFVCPPYEEVVYSRLVSCIASSPLIKEDTIVLIEYPSEIGTLPPVMGDGRLVGLRNRKYGRTVLGVFIADPTGRFDAEPRAHEFVPVHLTKKALKAEGYLIKTTA